MRRRTRTVLALATLGQLAIATAAVAPVHADGRVADRALSDPATAASITLVGHGNGHGVGLSQWGAYGAAVDLGWSAWQIVDHFFGVGTPGGPAHGSSDPDAVVTVALQALDGAQTSVVSAADLGGGMHSMLARSGPGGYTVWARAERVCAGASDTTLAGWTQLTTAQRRVTFSTAPSSATDAGQLVGVCQPNGTVRAYRGTIEAVTGTRGEVRTVNAVPVEQYLRSVVAKEMSPSWALAGGGRGMAALQAQVIAARSYALSEKLYSYAMTCDSLCQTYQGAAIGASPTGPFNAVEHPLSDPAVTSTAGMVLRNADGTFTHAMYSASSGGYTAFNAVLRFPAVADAGDATPGNPSHTWTTTLTAAALQSAYPSIGAFIGITVLARTGVGEWGGRVTSMTVEGTAGRVTVTGDQFRSAMGLRSTWFAPAGAPLAGTSTVTVAATALAPARRLR